MEILEIITVPFFSPRGTGFSSLDRTRALSDLGHSVNVLAYSLGDDVAIPNVEIHRIPRVPFIRTIKMGPSIKKLVLDAFLAAKTAIWLCRKRFDLVHVHEESAFWVTMLGFLHRGPVLYDMHSSLVEQLSNFGYSDSDLIKRVFSWLERKTIHRATGIIVICPELETLVRRLAPNTPVQLIENLPVGWNLPHPTEDDTEAIRREFDLKGHRTLLYTGTFGKNQGIELLVESLPLILKTHADVKLLLVGGTGTDLDRIRRWVDDLGLASHIIIEGCRDYRQMPAFMAAADVLLSPRIAGTNTPLKIYGYMASGTPIVATDLPTHTQCLTREVAELVDPTPAGISGGILRLLEQREYAQRLADAALQLVGERYGHSRYMSQVRQILEQTCNGKVKV